MTETPINWSPWVCDESSWTKRCFSQILPSGSEYGLRLRLSKQPEGPGRLDKGAWALNKVIYGLGGEENQESKILTGEVSGGSSIKLAAADAYREHLVQQPAQVIPTAVLEEWAELDQAGMCRVLLPGIATYLAAILWDQKRADKHGYGKTVPDDFGRVVISPQQNRINHIVDWWKMQGGRHEDLMAQAEIFLTGIELALQKQ